MGCGQSKAGDALANQQKQQEGWTNQSMGRINNAFAGFTPQFYQGVGQAYQDYQLPIFGKQLQQTQNQLGFRLANQGLGNSSQAQDLYNKLGQSKTDSLNQIASGALGQQHQMQQQVEQERSRLVGQAQSANNPGAIGQQAISSAAGFAAPSTFAPIGNMLGQFSELYLANQRANTYNSAIAQINSMNNPFGNSTSGNFLPSTSYRG